MASMGLKFNALITHKNRPTDPSGHTENREVVSPSSESILGATLNRSQSDQDAKRRSGKWKHTIVISVSEAVRN